MLALMATVGLAFVANAVNSTGFESYTGDFAYDLNDSGEASAPRYWVVTNTAPDLDLSGTVLTAYGESAKPEKVPDAFVDATTTNKYLKVDTNNEVLYRSVEAVDDVNALNAGTAIGDGLYFDANVQFTASDDAPTPDSADKLIVWMKATEGDEPSTNLMVTAGVYDEGTEKYVATPFVIDGNYSADTWYRLTVKAMVESDVTKFTVFVDDSQVKTGGVEVVFDSLVAAGEDANYDKLTAVGFKGTGAVDNLVWTTDDPFPVVPPTTVALTVSATGEGYSSLVYIVGESTTTNEVDGAAASIEAAVNDVITFVLTVADGNTPTVAGYELTKGEKQVDEFSDVYYPYTFTVTVTQEMVDDGLTLTINVTEDGEPPTPSTVVTPTADEIASGKIPVTGETTAIKVGGVDVPIEAFDVNAGVATVKAPVVAESAEAAGDAFVIDDDKDEVTINVNPVVGLFYGVAAEADLDDLARPAALTQYDGTNAAEIFTVSKPGAEKGFFKVYSDVKE